MLDDSPAIRGKGYAIEALNMVFEYCFDMLGLDEICVRTMEANAVMRGIIERKLGFEKITNLVKSDIAPGSPGAGGDYKSVGDVPLGRMERYWKLMSDRVEEGSTGGGSVLLHPQTEMEVVDELKRHPGRIHSL
jgi:Acetyltransferase (GNAT) domain